ncbi:3-hydroxyacyl-CoA dehydrogenase NAD-binding domain-containing protein [Chitinimonas lacunae]|uniref:3-hydroxyacyl-CoA dehydrogenase NAD-binding domain-containing protein n=1 Tax=Chitinimonas lacunae TaxID=1963018 RepID=A0ABV8MW48_9NEIS
MTSSIDFQRDADGVVTLTFDAPGRRVNTLDSACQADLAAAVERLTAEPPRGVILASAKRSFFAGGDLELLIAVKPADAEGFFREVEALKRSLRRLETLGVPVVAALGGSALGGGWELALACHYRVCVDDAAIELGMPEVTLGLMPGAGGVTRTVRRLGLQAAFDYLVEGRRFDPRHALEAGLIDQLVADPAQLAAAARSLIEAHPESRQPWDREGWRLPGGAPSSPQVAQALMAAPAMLRGRTHGRYPAPEAILAAMVEGAQVDFDTASRIESRWFTSLATGQVAKNMIGALWFDRNAVLSGASRPDAVPRTRFSRIGILGAGMMGAGIAYAAASRGIEVVLKDIDLERAERGRAHSARLLDKRLARGRIDAVERDAVLARIQPTDSAADLAGCELVIEAVFEDRQLKAQVTHEAEAVLDAEAMLASNTSTLPISGLARASERPQRFIGLHFFSPVDRMQLVEIIRGEATDDATVARAYDFVRQLGKLPIVVNDGRGFFTSRVFEAYVNEGMAMLAEGVAPALIERAAQMAGMPVGPLAVVDEVSLTLCRHIARQTEADFAAEGRPYPRHRAESVIKRMLDEFGRAGRAAGAGFYDYPADGEKRLWPGLAAFGGQGIVPVEELVDRFLFIQALETLRAVEDGVLRHAHDANIGSIFGLGFPAWTGGSLRFLEQYGLEAARERAQALRQRHGERFAPPARLLAAQGRLLD